MQALTFLTREGCVNTPEMQNNLDDALRKLGWQLNYNIIDIGKLPKTDIRTGYPTPTLLWEGPRYFRNARPQAALPRTDVKGLQGRSSACRCDCGRASKRGGLLNRARQTAFI
jgi:hypothetical protein